MIRTLILIGLVGCWAHATGPPYSELNKDFQLSPCECVPQDMCAVVADAIAIDYDGTGKADEDNVRHPCPAESEVCCTQKVVAMPSLKQSDSQESNSDIIIDYI